MAEVIFTHSHPLLKNNPLRITTKPDQITWGYGLNVAKYPTYGGEVVQILSVYFDDMNVTGTVSSYAEMEHIYKWFLTYMQVATQGRDNPSYNQQPVAFYYPERHWHFQIWPKALPGFRYGRDVVAPTWTLQAAVKEPDATFADQIKDYAANQVITTGPINLFGKATADFGATGDLANNPWADAAADPSAQGKTLMQWEQEHVTEMADSFSGFVQAYATGNLNKLPQFQYVSKMPDPVAPATSTTASKAKK